MEEYQIRDGMIFQQNTVDGRFREWQPGIIMERCVDSSTGIAGTSGPWMYFKETAPFQKEEISEEEFRRLSAELLSL